MQKKIVCVMSQSENLIMDYLWAEEEGKSFKEIMEFLCEKAEKTWAKQTVNTFLRRLFDKGLVRTEVYGRNKMYYAALTEEEYEQGRARKLLADFYGGSVSNFLSALTGGQKIDADFASQLRDLVEKAGR